MPNTPMNEIFANKPKPVFEKKFDQVIASNSSKAQTAESTFQPPIDGCVELPPEHATACAEMLLKRVIEYANTVKNFSQAIDLGSEEITKVKTPSLKSETSKDYIDAALAAKPVAEAFLQAQKISDTTSAKRHSLSRAASAA